MREPGLPLSLSSVGFWIASLVVICAILGMCIYFTGWIFGWWAEHSADTLSAVGEWGLGALIPAVGGLYVWNRINVEAHASRLKAWEKAIRVAPRIEYTPKDNALRPTKVSVIVGNPDGPTLHDFTLGIAGTIHARHTDYHLLGDNRYFAVTFEFPHQIARLYKDQTFKEQRKRATEYLAPKVRAAFVVDGHGFIRELDSCRLERVAEQRVRNEVKALKQSALRTTT